MRGGGIDRQQPPVRVVRADETQTVLDEVRVPPFALFERISRLLPGRGDLIELTRFLFRHAPPRGSHSSHDDDCGPATGYIGSARRGAGPSPLPGIRYDSTRIRSMWRAPSPAASSAVRPRSR